MRVVIPALLLVFSLVRLGAAETTVSTPTSSAEQDQSVSVRSVSMDELEMLNRKAKFDSMGKHWSGLDREELYEALAAGDQKQAGQLISKAAGKADRDYGLQHIVLELVASDDFLVFRENLREIARALLKEKKGAQTQKNRKPEESLLNGMVEETVLFDFQVAASSYAEVLEGGTLKSVIESKAPEAQIESSLKGIERKAALGYLRSMLGKNK